jgi:hypothetical protein
MEIYTLEKAASTKAEYISAVNTRSDLLEFDSYDVKQYSLDAI